ncbi:MAG: DUF4359 domain-containing protein [Cyanobium sp.]
MTNPGRDDFEPFAAEQLTKAAVEELCDPSGLPVIARLMVRDCPGLIRSQRPVLGKLALAATQRRNFLLFSLYRTDLGGQQVLPDWRIPRYRATTLAAAGRFLLLPQAQGGSGAEAQIAAP